MSAPSPTAPDPASVSEQPESNLRYWLALLHTPGVGPATSHRLLEKFSSPETLFSLPRGELQQAGVPQPVAEQLQRTDWSAVDRDLLWLEAADNHLLTCQDPQYPRLLAESGQHPPLLFVHGQMTTLSQLQLAIVGSRHPSRAGEQNALAFSRHLAMQGLVITSGLALGIDACAHQGALDAGGRSLAVMGTGLDRVYPASHRQLAHRIAEQGALISELPPGTPPQAQNFPRRNRIISGLSLGVLVVEAARRSGSLITARCALDQGRDVFAIPGSIHNPLSRGCHELIRNGAKLVEAAEHILEELGSLALGEITGSKTAPCADSRPAEIDNEYQQLLQQMGHDPVTIDELVSHCSLTPEQLSSMLLILELEGYVTSGHGGRYTRTRKEKLT